MSVLSLVFLGVAAAQDPREIVLRSVTLDQRDQDLRRNYTYQIRIEQRRNAPRREKDASKSETYEVLVLYGAPYRRLIARDDQPLTPEEERKEQRKLDKEAEKRQKATARDPERLAREEARRTEEQKALVREIAEAYTFRIAGEEPVGGHDAWAIEAEPVPGYRPRSSRARLLPNFRGKLWITKGSYRWAKVEAEAIRTVSFGWILARLQPGSRLVFEQQPVEEGFWMPSRAHMTLSARVALLRRWNAEVDIRFTNYRKFQSESRILEMKELAPEPPAEP